MSTPKETEKAAITTEVKPGRSTPDYTFNPETGKFTWPRDEQGNKIQSYKEWTPLEKQGYRDYRKSHGTSGVKKAQEWDQLKELVSKSDVSDEEKDKIMKLISSLKGSKKSSILNKLCGVDTAAELAESYTRTSLMYRTPDGNRFFNDVEFMDAVNKYGPEIQCVYTWKEVGNMLQKLESQGIKVKVIAK